MAGNSQKADGTERDFVWVVDPVDGTSNFINGFPLFAASIGVLYRGCPVVGAIWCSTGHALRSGVYHAHRGGALMAAAECEIWVEQDDGWALFERFEAPATRAGGQRPTLRDWRCALIAGTPKAAAALRKTVGAD